MLTPIFRHRDITSYIQKRHYQIQSLNVKQWDFADIPIKPEIDEVDLIHLLWKKSISEITQNTVSLSVSTT